MVPDPAAVKPFYEAVLGWTFTEPDDAFGGYVMALKGEAPVAGMGPQADGGRTAWTMYFASDDADAAAAGVRAAGGTVLRDPDDVGPLGRMFVADDPTGARFGVWQAGTFPGSAVSNEPGSLIWEDLRSTEPDAAREFYAAVFGHEYSPMDMASPDYMTFATAGDDRPRGGMGGMMGAEGVGSHWLLYFSVDDLEESLAAATAHGGAVPIPPFETPFGPMAGITDPSGATVWLVQTPPESA